MEIDENYVLDSLATSSGYMIPKGLLIACEGDCGCAVLMAYLLNQRRYYKSHAQLVDDWFYATSPDIMTHTGISERTQYNLIKQLTEKKWIQCRVQGVPPKRWIQLNANNIAESIMAGLKKIDDAHRRINPENCAESIRKIAPNQSGKIFRINPEKSSESFKPTLKEPTLKEPKEVVSKETTLQQNVALLQYCISLGPKELPPTLKEFPPIGNFNPLRPFDPENNYIPLEESIQPRCRTDWWSMACTVGEGHYLQALPYFNDLNWEDGPSGQTPFAFGRPDLCPRDPNKPTFKPGMLSDKGILDKNEIELPATTMVAKIGHIDSKLVSEPIPHELLNTFLIKNKKIFSHLQFKAPVTKTELLLCKILNQIRHRTFVSGYEWKPGWLDGKISKTIQLPGDVGGLEPMTWTRTFEILQDSVDCLVVAQQNGLNYPKRVGLSFEKIGICNYLLNQNPGGTTSPFLGFLLGNHIDYTKIISTIKAGLKPEIVSIGEHIFKIKGTERGTVWSLEHQHNYWVGLKDLLDWRAHHLDDLEKCDSSGGNKLWLNTSVNMMKMLNDYFTGSNSNNSWLRWEFIGPDKPGWDAISAWCLNRYNVNFDITKVKTGRYIPRLNS